MKFLTGILLVLVVVFGGLALPSARAGAAPLSNAQALEPAVDVQDGVRLLSSTDGGVTLEVSVPWERLSADPARSGYVSVSLPGWAAASRAGAPALPFLAQAIGVPFGVGLTVQVEPGPAHTMVLPAPALPAATQKAELDLPGITGTISAPPVPGFAIKEDPSIYGRDAAYPGVLAEVTSDGVVRQQRVVGVVAYPVQYNPATRQLTVYESLRLEVRFDGQVTAGAEVDDSAAYEQVFRRSLLNYEGARMWRSAAPSRARGADLQGGVGTEGDPWAPPNPGWRVKIREEGFYRLNYDELNGAGLPVDSLDPSTFQLFNLGSEVAVYVEGEADGSFDSNDSILFYGQAVASKYTAENVYWLTYDASGATTGQRMGSRDGTPGGAATPDHYPARRPMEVNAYYRSTAPGDDALERWLWEYVYPPSLPSWTHTFSLAAPYAGAYDSATLTIVLMGSLDHAIYPDHHVTISLNGTQVADVWWDGITWQTVQVPVAQGLLQAGDNTLSVVAPNDTGVGIDFLFVDRLELEFANTFLAEANVLPFGYDVNGTWQFQVDGFATNDVVVYDVTDPVAVVRMEGVGVTGAGPYSALFEDTLGAPADYWAMASSAYQTVMAIEADTASDLGSPANAAEHIVITHQEFAAQAAQLRDYRASQGLGAMSVDVQDVYDEFGYGIVGAAPIHDFLAYAYGNWATAPSFVVLVGDGHYDPKDYLGYGRVSYLPPYLADADPWDVETAADNRYVTLAGGDTLPEMMLGRLAVNSSAEASAFVDKIVAYEQSPVQGDWQGQVLAVADDADDGGDFAALSDSLLDCCLPEPYQAQKVYYGVTHSTLSDARTAILDGFDAGALIVNYIGHAGTNAWAGEGLFRTTDVAGLANGGRLPVMLPMSCMEGYYASPTLEINYDAVAEVVTRAAGKGAVASWSPTGKAVASGHEYLNRGFYQSVFTDPDGSVTLGQATTDGKLSVWASGSNRDLVDTYLLFGDPATKIALVPEDPPAMHVGGLDGFKPGGNKKFWWAGVTILILDQDDNPVANATVTGLWSDGVSGTSSCLTDGAGLCTGSSPKISTSQPSVTFTVSDVSHPSLPWVPGEIMTIVVHRDAPVNEPPVASFAYSCTDLSCAFNASGSHDPDGTIVSYDWDFGDGQTGSGVEASHDYDPAGVYTVVLTVTDDGGATGSETQSVPVGVEPLDIYVFNIAMSGKQAGPNLSARAGVTIYDTQENPVEGATVYGDWSVDDRYIGSVEGTTGADGRVALASRRVKGASATFTFEVTNVVKDGFTYNPALNVETSDTITVP